MAESLPNNLEAERSILGSVLVHNEAFKVASQFVQAGDFYRDAHRVIWSAMSSLAERGCAIDFIILKDELSAAGKLDAIGGPAYVASLADGMPRAANVEYYARIVKEKARLRRLIEIADKLSSRAYEEDGAAAIAADVRGMLAPVAHSTSSSVIPADEAVAAYVKGLDEGDLGPPIFTGLIDLDALLGGFRKGELIVVAARPGVGKTSFMLGISEFAARHGHRVCDFSLEMTARDIAARLLSMRSGVSHKKIEDRSASAEEYAAVAEAMNNGTPGLMLEERAKTVGEVRGHCERLLERGPLSLVCVDYMQRLAPDRHRESDEGEMKLVSAALAALAKELDVCVVALSQLNRAPEGRRDKRPSPADLRGSGAIEQDAHRILLLFREELYAPKPENDGVAECIVAKNRNGPLGVVRLAFRKDLSRFGSLSSQG